jgi:hypothetical protein
MQTGRQAKKTPRYIQEFPAHRLPANLRQWLDKSSAELFRIATNKIRIAMLIANLRNGEALTEEDHQFPTNH